MSREIIVPTLPGAILVLVACAYACRNEYYNDESRQFEALNEAWMLDIPDETPLSDLAIPGTDHSMAYSVDPAYNTQGQGLRNQLDAGIRALHFGLRHIKDRFTIHHGNRYLGVNFGTALEICNDFLWDNPGEIILLFLEKQHDESECSRSFEETFFWYRTTYEGRFIWRGTRIPTLGEVRRKIVIVDHMPGEQEKGISPPYIQQRHIVSSNFGASEKLKKVLAHMQLEKQSSKLSVNWLSGAGKAAMPSGLAANVNHDICYYLWISAGVGKRDTAISGYMPDSPMPKLAKRPVDQNSCRVMMMDYPGERLIEHIINLNRHLKPKYSKVF